MTKTDVLVIGGGIVGQVAAVEIATTGAKVVVVDADRHSGSTANAGSLHVQMQSRFMRLYPQHVAAMEASLPLYAAAVTEWERLEALHGPFGLVRKGGLMVAESEDQFRFLRRKAERERRMGLDVEVLNRPALEKIAPWLGDHVVGAELCANEGKLDPLAANLALKAAAYDAGVTFETAEIMAIEAGTSIIAKAEGATWMAEKVVVAASWGTGRLLKPFDLSMPTEAEPLHMNITEPCTTQIQHLIQHAERSITLKQLGSGQIVIGGGWPADDQGKRPPAVRPTSLIGNVCLAARLAPALRDVRILRTWAGMNTTIDGASTVGPLSGDPRIVVAVPGDAGYTLGPLVARMAASFVTGHESPFDPAPFSPSRFAD